MLKKDSKIRRRVADKNNLNIKHHGNDNFRSINNYQAMDKIPNDNLYKNDNLYSINKYFEFSSKEEPSFRLFCYYHFQKDKIKPILFFFYLRFFFSNIYNFFDLFSLYNILNMKNIIHLISLFLSFLFRKETLIKKNIYSVIIFYLLLFNQSLHLMSIYNEKDWENMEYLIISSESIFNFIFVFFIGIQLKYIFFPQIIMIFLYFYSIKRFAILNLVYYSISFLIYILLRKSIREIWALYDSFKRSFYNINDGLLESDPNPIFIISKDKYILYKNSVATKLMNDILDTPPQNSHKKNQRMKETNINFLDIIHPSLRELFKKLLNDVMEDENVSNFNFPLCKVSNKSNLNIDVSNAYDIYDDKNYLFFAWFQIIICRTEWKNKIAFYMCFYPCEDVLLNEIFYQYAKRFSEKIENVIANIDIICGAVVNKTEKKINKSKDPSPSSYDNSEVKNFISEKKKQDEDEEEEEQEEDEGDENEDEEKNDRKKKDEIFTLKTNIYQLLIDNANNDELNNTILFFFKNQVEFLYDYSLTIELYFNMLYKERNFKFCFEHIKPNLKKRIKIKELQLYYKEYFYEFTKDHKYQLEFKFDDNKNIFDVYIEENYLRIILFNIIIFMICHLDDKSEPTSENKKEILIKIIPELKDETPNSNEGMNSNEEQFKYTPKEFNDSEKSIKKGELSFIFESFSTKGDLNRIQEIINQKNKTGSHVKSEIIKLNYLDVGILTVNYLLGNYYKTKLKMSNKEGEQLIKFKLPCELEQLNDIQNSKKNHQANVTLDSSSFFSPLMSSKKSMHVNRPSNFYNYNQKYNKKVLNIFYGIDKSPILSKRHKKANPSFSQFNDLFNRNRRCSRHLSQSFQKYVSEPIKYSEKSLENNGNIIYIDQEDKKESEEKIKNSNNHIEEGNSFDSNPGSFKSERLDNENISDNEEEKITNFLNFELNEELEEKIEENKASENIVLIFESQNNEEFISFLKNESKDEYNLKIVKDINEEENELDNNGNKCKYKVLLVNMGINKEIKFAERVCKNKGESLIYGYHFGVHTRSREKNNVKYDKRFDLSFSFEGILYALNHTFINSTSIIK